MCVYANDFNWKDTNTPQIKITNMIPPNSVVLEIGCAAGRITRKLTEKGCRVDCVEFDPAAAKIASQYSRQMVVGNIENDAILNSLFPTKYDAIIFSDLLEHLVNPDKVLASVKRNLKPTGFIYISMPNVLVWHTRWQFLLGRFNYTESGTLDKTHLRFFTFKTTKEMIAGTGYQIISTDISYNFPFGKWSYIFVRKVCHRLEFFQLWHILETPLRFVSKKLPGLFGNHFVFKIKPQ